MTPCDLYCTILNLVQTRERWIDNYYTQRDKALSALPYPVRVVVGLMIYRSHSQMLHGQGTGRFTAAEAKQLREEIWTTLDGMLAESRKKRAGNGKECFWCLAGEEPTECDTSLYGFICSALVAKR
jgi:hypothetical protein